jgi:hypothetical protein
MQFGFCFDVGLNDLNDQPSCVVTEVFGRHQPPQRSFIILVLRGLEQLGEFGVRKNT